MMDRMIQRQCSCGGSKQGSAGECASCRAAKRSSLAPPEVESVLRSSGRPLDHEVRAFMEPRFGQRLGGHFGAAQTAAAGMPQTKLAVGEPGDRHERQADSTAQGVMQGGGAGGARPYDFSGVRIHTDRAAASSAAAMQARAYTVGSDIVFGDGEYRPQTSEGRRLIAHELTHVVQQGSASVEPRVQRDLIAAGGYKRPYKSDDAEIASAKAGTWYPASNDFAQTLTGSGGGSSAGTFDDLITWISNQSAGSISTLGLVGHASTTIFGLSGTVTVNPADVTFTAPGEISTSTIASKLANITPVRDRFAKGAKIILYGCHAGVGDALMEALSNAFQVCVEGFSDQIWWCIHWTGNQIDSRGRTWMDTAGLMASGLLKPDCLTTFDADIRKLKPDKSKCTGVAGGTKGKDPTKQSTEEQEAPTPVMEGA